MNDTIRWGIVGPGIIANRFANAVKNVAGAEIVAVASRSPTSLAGLSWCVRPLRGCSTAIKTKGST